MFRDQALLVWRYLILFVSNSHPKWKLGTLIRSRQITVISRQVELLPKLPSALWAYRVIFFASALNFAQRFFVAFPIFALAAAESTRLALFVTFLSADRPMASAAALMPFSLR